VERGLCLVIFLSELPMPEINHLICSVSQPHQNASTQTLQSKPSIPLIPRINTQQINTNLSKIASIDFKV